MPTLKHTIICALLLLMTAGLAAQTEKWDWSLRAGGFSDDMGEAIATDAEGNCYVAGSFISNANFGDISLTGNGVSDVFCGKLDSEGNWLWVNKIGGMDDVYARSITVSDSGYIFITGSYYGTINFGDISLQSDGYGNAGASSDTFVAKLDPSGNWLWAVSSGGLDFSDGRCVRTDEGGNAYICGRFYTAATFGSFNLTSVGSSDFYIAKLDPAGHWLWAISGGGVRSDHIFGLDIDPAGNLVVTGNYMDTVSFGNQVFTSQGNDVHDIFVGKLNPGGNWLWARSCGGISDDWSYRVITDSSGNIYIAGLFRIAATFGPYRLTAIEGSYAEVFVAKLNASGAWLWARQAGGYNVISCNDLAIDSYDNLQVAGGFTGQAKFGTITKNSSGSNDIFVAKINSAGTWLAVQSAGGPGFDIAYALAIDSENNIYVTGYFNLNSTFGENPIMYSQGGKDIFVARMSAKTPVSDPAVPSPAAFLLEQNYPNPFNPSTTISFEVRKPSIGYTLDIYDIRGARVRRLAQGFLGRGRHSVSFDGKDERGRDLASGTYLLRLSGEGESQTRKMLLLK